MREFGKSRAAQEETLRVLGKGKLPHLEIEAIKSTIPPNFHSVFEIAHNQIRLPSSITTFLFGKKFGEEFPGEEQALYALAYALTISRLKKVFSTEGETRKNHHLLALKDVGFVACLEKKLGSEESSQKIREWLEKFYSGEQNH